MIDEDGLLASFAEESQEHLQTIEPALLELEKSGDKIDSEMINEIFRSIHSIKGASDFFGLEQIGKLSHIMENLLSLLRDGKISVTPELTDALLIGVDALRTMVDDVTTSEELDIQSELTALQEIFSKVSEGVVTGKKVSVKEKQNQAKPKSNVLTYDIDEEEVGRVPSLLDQSLVHVVNSMADCRVLYRTPVNEYKLVVSC